MPAATNGRWRALSIDTIQAVNVQRHLFAVAMLLGDPFEILGRPDPVFKSHV